jgi:endoglycosylceramidase
VIYASLIICQHLVFFESVTWDDFIVGFLHPPGGFEYGNRSILSYHIYMPPNISPIEAFATRMFEVYRLGCGGFLTEFSLSDPVSTISISGCYFIVVLIYSNFHFCLFITPQDDATMLQIMSLADDNLQSWMLWDYKAYSEITGWDFGFFLPNGSANEPIYDVVSRTYPMATAGFIKRFSYDGHSYNFTLTYTLRLSCTLPTDVYFNQKLHYPHGKLRNQSLLAS